MHFPTYSLWMNTMNRCLAQRTIRFFVMVAIVLVWTFLYLPNPAAAQTMLRHFPPSAKRAVLVVTAPPEVLINGNPARLSPGARIKAANNLLVMSASLVGNSVLVNYMRNQQGLISEVWILSKEEAQEQRAGMETVTNIVFGSDADKPKTDDGKTPFNQLPKYPQQ